MKIELPPETEDVIVTAVLKECLKDLKENIRVLRRIKERKPHQEEDLRHDTEVLAAMKTVYAYFGGE